MTLLWISLIVCVVVMATVALSLLEHQRRLFFAMGSREARATRQRKRTYSDRLRRMRSAFRALLAGITPRRGERMLHAAGGGSSNVSPSVPLRQPLREHAAQIILRAMREAGAAPPPAAVLPAAPAAANGSPAGSMTALEPAIDTVVSTTVTAGEGIIRVDTSGQLQAADAIARALLHWSGGTLSLSDVLAGGSREAAALLEAVARREVVEQTVTVVAGGAPQQVHVTALASRSRDRRLYGALLIIRRL